MKRNCITKTGRALVAGTLPMAALAALMIGAMPSPGHAADRSLDEMGASSIAASRSLSLGVGKSVVIDLPRDVKDVLVADPKIANAVVRSAQRAYIIGAAVGQTNIVFFDSNGQQIAGYDIAVTRDLNGIRSALKQVIPNGDIRVEGIGEGVMLSGTVSSPAEAQQAYDIAIRLVGDEKRVANTITIRSRDQVMLKVTVAEVQRDIVKQLGVDLNAKLSYGTAVVNFNNANPFPAYGRTLADNNILSGTFGNSVTATLRAMETAGVVRTLAEPNLTAISGESASFLAGGEFPVPTGYTCDPPGSRNCTLQVTFKQFGIALNFTPVVLSEGRISLRVKTEVSELSTDSAVQLSGTSIPSIKTRRAETTLEIPSGGSMAMAGLIQEQTKQAISGMPGVAQLPVLGTLFRSRDYVNRNSELVVLVTPYVVRAVAQKDLSRPDDGFTNASDPQANLLGTVNRLYGVPGRTSNAQTYRGRVGFITD